MARIVRLADECHNIDLHLSSLDCPVCGGAGCLPDYDDVMIGCQECGGLGLVPNDGDTAAMDAEADGQWFADDVAPF